MTPEELQASYNELSRLANELRERADTQANDGMQRIAAQVGHVLAQMGRMLAASKSELDAVRAQVDEIAASERNRDRSEKSKRDEWAMRFFARLTVEERERLVHAVEVTSPNTSVEAFAKQVAKASRLTEWSVNNVLQWLGDWYAVLGTSESEEDVNSVASMLVDPFPLDPPMEELLQSVGASNSASPFTLQLKRLLRCHSTLGVSRKAQMLLLGRNERQFGYSNISTDIRPIFKANVDAAPTYAVLLHDLVLGVSEAGITRTIGITLTSKDVLRLGEVLNRAWKKDQTLRSHAAYKILTES